MTAGRKRIASCSSGSVASRAATGSSRPVRSAVRTRYGATGGQTGAERGHGRGWNPAAHDRQTLIVCPCGAVRKPQSTPKRLNAIGAQLKPLQVAAIGASVLTKRLIAWYTGRIQPSFIRHDVYDMPYQKKSPPGSH
eukprot:7331359-Prymnesium_polylepis.2